MFHLYKIYVIFRKILYIFTIFKRSSYIIFLFPFIFMQILYLDSGMLLTFHEIHYFPIRTY